MMRVYTLIDHRLETIVGRTHVAEQAAAGVVAYLDALDPATDVELVENNDVFIASCFGGPTVHVYASTTNVYNNGRVHTFATPAYLMETVEGML